MLGPVSERMKTVLADCGGSLVSSGAVKIHSLLALSWLACSAGLGCAGGQSTDDFAPHDSKSCDAMAQPIRDPEPELLATLARVNGIYAIGGRLGAAQGLVTHTPSDRELAGELEVTLDTSALVQRTQCERGIEAAAELRLRSSDGVLEARFSGLALLHEQLNVAGRDAAFRVTLTADIPRTQLTGTLAFEPNADWKVDRVQLRVLLTPYGSRGGLRADIVQASLDHLGPNEHPTSPPPSMLAYWPQDDGRCLPFYEDAQTRDPWFGDEQGDLLTPADTQDVVRLNEALATLEGQELKARYADGTATELTLQLREPASYCSTGYEPVSVRTAVRLQTADGRLDLSTPVTIEPSSELRLRTAQDRAWAVRADRLEGHLDADLRGSHHVGIDLQLNGVETPQGELRVLGYAPGDCGLCNAGGCAECAWERRMELLTLTLEAGASSSIP